MKRAKTVKIEFLYFDDCPSHKQTLENLEAVLTDLKLNVELTITRVQSPDQAEKLEFYGSPSIKINGIDLERSKRKYSYNCRLYNIAGKLTGVPTKEFIQTKLANFL